MSKKTTLTAHDKQIIDDFNTVHEAGLNALEKAQRLNVGDYLTLRLDYHGQWKQQTNSYGAPIKYVVVHTTKHGIPFLKKINKKGEPVGKLYSCMGTLESDDYRWVGQKFEFELDSDYADALLLQSEYDPAQLHKSKKDIWNAVTEHNKNNKIPTHNLNDIATFLSTVNVGDMLWRSARNHVLVQDKKIMSRKEYSEHTGVKGPYVKGPHLVVLTLVDSKGKIFEATADYFHRKALYKSKPRSYKELNI